VLSAPQLILSLSEEDLRPETRLVEGQFVCMHEACGASGPAVAHVQAAWCNCAKCGCVSMFVYRGGQRRG
jgi:hypothetical protein